MILFSTGKIEHQNPQRTQLVRSFFDTDTGIMYQATLNTSRETTKGFDAFGWLPVLLNIRSIHGSGKAITFTGDQARKVLGQFREGLDNNLNDKLRSVPGVLNALTKTITEAQHVIERHINDASQD